MPLCRRLEECRGEGDALNVDGDIGEVDLDRLLVDILGKNCVLEGFVGNRFFCLLAGKLNCWWFSLLLVKWWLCLLVRSRECSSEGVEWLLKLCIAVTDVVVTLGFLSRSESLRL